MHRSTRCPECCQSLKLTDWDDPDVVIALHLNKVHDEPFPAWWPKEG